jgi:hypothetical protein
VIAAPPIFPACDARVAPFQGLSSGLVGMAAAALAATPIREPECPSGHQHRRPTITATQLLTLMASPCDAMLFLESVASAIGPGAFLRMPAR